MSRLYSTITKLFASIPFLLDLPTYRTLKIPERMTDPLQPPDTEPRHREASPPSISRKTFPVAGINTIVFGLDELPSDASEVACLWLLHPRLATHERMTPIAAAVVSDWNKRIQEGRAGTGKVKGLIAVSFDQRNHGARLIDPECNESWKKENPRHAQDMFSVFREFRPKTGGLGHSRELMVEW